MTDGNERDLRVNAAARAADQNSPEEVFGEIGLVLIVVLGIVLAINVIAGALHVV